ncbi:MAG: redoxin domain-containing protein [Lachnospiraceae bacterium]|nr:redoxin domain-containing protein [Lachnospiraceae bacterium]
MNNMNQNYNNGQLQSQQTVYQYPNSQQMSQGGYYQPDGQTVYQYPDDQQMSQGGYYQPDGQTVYQYPDDQQMSQGGYYQPDGQTVYQYIDDQQMSQGGYNPQPEDMSGTDSFYQPPYTGTDGYQPFIQPIDVPKKKNTSKIVIGIVFSVVAIAMIAVAVIFLLPHLGNSDYKDKLELATRYLNEQDFEEAVESFRAAIEIDPKNQDAYIGLANTYAAMGDEYFYNQPLTVDDYNKMLDYYNQALAVLNNSKEYLESETVNVMISNIQKKFESVDNQKQELEEKIKEEEYKNSFEGIREELISQYGYGYEVGQIMPDFEFTDLDGNIVNLSDFLGKPLYLNTFTTWCPYCDMEVGDMQETYNQYGDSINFIMIDLEENAYEVRNYAERFSLTIPMYLLPDWWLGSYKVEGVPTTFVLDKYGRIDSMTIGLADADWILSATQSAIAASED